MAVLLPAGSPFPRAGMVQPAPAAAPELVAAAVPGAAEAERRSVPRLDVPAEFLSRLNRAVAEGAADAVAFAREHTPAERWMVPDWAMLRMVWPPKDDSEDLAYLHAVARTRTPEGVEAARHWSKHGLTDEWEKLLEQYTRRVGPVQARSASKLLHDALMMVNTITQTAKAGAARKRPFVVDPSLPLAVDRPGNNPSYPSGHATAAYAACLVLAHLMPDRRAEFMSLAQEASWARVYAGVHFPTDVLAGVKLATTVTNYLIDNSMAKPMRGTGTAVNPGVAGGRRALQGSVHLPGQPLDGAANLGGAAAVMGQGQPGT